MKRKFSLIIAVLFSISIMSLASGCTTSGKSSRRAPDGITQQGRNLAGSTTNIFPGTGMTIGTPLPGITPGITPGVTPGYGLTRQIPLQLTGFNMSKADNITRQLGKISGVKQINTVILGSTALISCSTTNPKMNLNSVKSTIARRVKQIDPAITTVYVADSTDMMNKIKLLGNDIKANKTNTELSKRFNQLIKSLKPITF